MGTDKNAKNKKRLSSFAINNIKCYGIVLLAFAILYPMQMMGMLSFSLKGQLVPICTYVVMAISLNLTVGYLGELSLGHAGFMSVGAFSGVIAATMLSSGIPVPEVRLLISVIIGGIFAGIAGFVIGIPVLRLRGDYLAIVTLAFGEIIKNILNCMYVGFDAAGLHFSMKNAESLNLMNGTKGIILNGPQGASHIAKIATFPAAIILVLFALFVVLNLVNSKNGRAISAIRTNRIAAESVGIGVTRYKLTAFIISAAIAGMAGAMYAQNLSSVNASKFDFNLSILILVFVVLGGMKNIFGSIIATALLYMLPEVLRGIANYRMLVYAVILIVVMLLTNNEKVRGFFDNIKARLKGKRRRS